MVWHPVEALQIVEMVFPLPGTDEPFAIIRWVNVTLEGEPVSRWRAVTASEPRQLIGYYGDPRSAAMGCHKAAVAAMVPAALNETIR